MKFLPSFARDEVLKEQVKLVRDSYLSSAAGFLIVCAFITFIAYRELGDIRAIIWFVALVVIYCAWSLRQYLQSDDIQGSPRKFATLEVFKVLSTNLVFCCFPIMFMTETSPPILVISTSIAAGGLAAGSVAMQGPCLPVFYAYSLPKMIVPIIALVLIGGYVNWILTVAMILFLLLIIRFAQKIERNIIQSIELRFENQGLVHQLRLTLAKADEASNAKSVFLNSASHDLRQPLHALALMTEVMGNTQLNAKQIELQSNMMSAVESTRGMLDSLLNMSKLESGTVLSGPKPFLVQTIFDRIDAEMWQAADDKGISYNARATDAVANSDILIVELIIRNLISNAIRYTDAGGILVACRRRKPDLLLIEVWDSGIGIRASKTKDIFKPFQQIKDPKRDSNDGFGLGLAITQKLADTMGISIGLNSVVNRGSVFRFELPVAEKPALNIPAVEKIEISFAQKAVLIIDDHHGARTSAQELIHSWGCKCIAAESLTEALSKLKDCSVDIMIVDSQLGIDNAEYDAIHAIRQYLNIDIPAIIITGDTTPERMQEATNAIASLMYKPISGEQLKRTISRSLTGG